MKFFIAFFLCILFARQSASQELFINTEPASNMPRNSYGFRLGSENFIQDKMIKSRTDFEFMYGFSADLMGHIMVHSSNYYGNYNYNNFGLYAKYRLYTDDGFKSHFRIAGYAEGAFGKQRNTFADIELEGGNSGFGAGLIFTELQNRLAISSTIGIITLVPVVEASPGILFEKISNYSFSLSAGYLIYPPQYTGYNNLNFNLYCELLGKYIAFNKIEDSQNTAEHGTVLDLAVGPQFIINSLARLDLSVRTRLISGVDGFPKPSVFFRYEQMFYH
jgi:hypothetical protein